MIEERERERERVGRTPAEKREKSRGQMAIFKAGERSRDRYNQSESSASLRYNYHQPKISNQVHPETSLNAEKQFKSQRGRNREDKSGH